MALNDRIDIRVRQDGSDDWGQPSQSWVPQLTVWGDARFLSGVGAIQANAELSDVRASIRVRANPRIQEGQRVLARGKEMVIKAILPDSEVRGFVFLTCEGVS